MTRINCVPVDELSGKHLVAEYRELPRIFTLAKQMAGRADPPPNANRPYILGAGHMLSFTGRLLWLHRRYDELVREMLRRYYAPNFLELPAYIKDIPPFYWNDWKPTEQDIAVCWERLRERMPTAYSA